MPVKLYPLLNMLIVHASRTAKMAVVPGSYKLRQMDELVKSYKPKYRTRGCGWIPSAPPTTCRPQCTMSLHCGTSTITSLCMDDERKIIFCYVPKVKINKYNMHMGDVL